MAFLSKDKKRALLKGRIDLACEKAQAFIDAQAAAIKAGECANLPIENIKMMLVRGQCPCQAALRLINGD